MKREYKGYRLIDGTIDNSACRHLHVVDDDGALRCQTCGLTIRDTRTAYEIMDSVTKKLWG